jgi:hypothetical protein
VEGNTIDTTLRRGLLVIAALLLLLLCYGVFRVSMVIYRVEQTVITVNQKIDAVGDRLAKLEQKAEQAAGVEDLERKLDRAVELRRDFQQAGSLSPEGHAEVKHLLSRIRTSGLRFEAAGDDDSALEYYAQCFAKYQAYDRALRSPEDFIDKLAGRTTAGDEYFVVHADGHREPVTQWLRARLAEHRGAAAAATTRPAQ